MFATLLLVLFSIPGRVPCRYALATNAMGGVGTGKPYGNSHRATQSGLQLVPRNDAVSIVAWSVGGPPKGKSISRNQNSRIKPTAIMRVPEGLERTVLQTAKTFGG